MREEQKRSLEGLRARAMTIPMEPEQRSQWAAKFNRFAAMRHFGATLDLSDDQLVRVVLPKVEEHHRGGLGTSAVNGAVIAGMFDCALGVAGVMQFPGQRTGTALANHFDGRDGPHPGDVVLRTVAPPA